MKKRILCGLMSVVMMLGVLTGCNKGSNPQKPNPSKSVSVSVPKGGWPERWDGDEFSKKAPSVESFKSKAVDVSDIPTTDYNTIAEMVYNLGFITESDRLLRRYIPGDNLDKLVGEVDDFSPKEGTRRLKTENGFEFRSEYHVSKKDSEVELRIEEGQNDDLNLRLDLYVGEDDYSQFAALFVGLAKSLGYDFDEGKFYELLACMWRDYKDKDCFGDDEENDKAYAFLENQAILTFDCFSEDSIRITLMETRYKPRMKYSTGFDICDVTPVELPEPGVFSVYADASGDSFYQHLPEGVGENFVPKLDEDRLIFKGRSLSMEENLDELSKLLPDGYVYQDIGTIESEEDNYEFEAVPIQGDGISVQIRHLDKDNDNHVRCVEVTMNIDNKVCGRKVALFLDTLDNLGIHFDREKMAQLVSDCVEWSKEAYYDNKERGEYYCLSDSITTYDSGTESQDVGQKKVFLELHANGLGNTGVSTTISVVDYWYGFE